VSELTESVKDQILGILAYGATPVTSVEGFLHGRERLSVREVIQAYPDLFELFERGFPETGPRVLWVRLKRKSDPGPGDQGTSES
jgi:hypothetical protein